MKRRGFTYISSLFAFLILMSAFVISLKTISSADDTEKIVRIKKELAAENLRVVEEISAKLKNGEQAELNDYSTKQTKVTITADENSAVFLVEVKSQKSGIIVENTAVLYRTEGTNE